MVEAGVRTALAERVERLSGCEVKAGEPLAPLTSVRVGGAAEALIRPRSPDALVALLKLARDEGIPVTVLGGGANTLVGDGGVPGFTVKLPSDLFPEVADMGPEEGRLTLGAGSAIVRLVNLMRGNGLVGAEFLAGIPGTLGGAVAMNAGTKNGEAFRVIEAVEVATADGVGWLTKAQVPHAYRHSELPPGGVVTRVRFHLRKGDVVASKAAMDADLGYRKRTQPLSQPNFGSVFTNPPGDHAGRLIEAVGLKGHTLGRAQVSTLHANWIVNLGGATARDVLGLVTLMQQRVREETGVEMKPEVKRVGDFLP
ncbi:UDP-N-acetylmuramate dehydrogenase [Pyxidicoccus fallax]|uniref:UDP-N-acetylenolpyruvoylglucosamine reductase n=1 Tax=Pyxidicoccus fallax TaxID=394095 RepID=A0A848L9I1_9BACT|nr:UDP-N-acetylmuramate dehydrogenase [Pyxidicoccus fallax]NMO15499.1 UDP-N-acetylmuramate dehydrogenase [Pyxidicoccus fallax]NPC86186.1 UDP-N-acetylmuramate dehydrogenase [Pyxidicoccus fallax]